MQVPTLSNPEILLRLGLALLLGAVVGLERERGERAAGMRTHALVCLGAALITVVSTYGFSQVLGSRNVQLDPSRVAAQIVSGIGFLGAGTIILRREVVRGLTTAAGLWVVAGVGMAAGAGLYLASIAGTAGALLILAVLSPIERRLFPRGQLLTLHLRPRIGQLAEIRAILTRSGVELRSLALQSGGHNEEDTVRLYCHPSRSVTMDDLVDRLRTVPGLVYLEASGGPSFGWSEPDEEDDRPATR